MLNKKQKQSLSNSILHHWENFANVWMAIQSDFDIHLNLIQRFFYYRDERTFEKMIASIKDTECDCCLIFADGENCQGCPIARKYNGCTGDFGWLEALEALEQRDIILYLEAEQKMIHNMEQFLDEKE